MDHILIRRAPLQRLGEWLGRLAIVADDDGVETDYLPAPHLLDRSAAPATFAYAVSSPQA